MFVVKLRAFVVEIVAVAGITVGQIRLAPATGRIYLACQIACRLCQMVCMWAAYTRTQSTFGQTISELIHAV